jgi:lipid-A-disaccharide synthase
MAPSNIPVPQHPSTRTILIAAGETSGDILGAELMAELRKHNPDITFTGIGGTKMKAAGQQQKATLRAFPGMGLLEVLHALPRLYMLLNKLELDARKHKPSLCITIDNQEFSARLAARLAPLGVPCIQYVAPKVWAWRQHRVHKLKHIFSHMLCLFPFEAAFFNKHNLPATYIGHPIIKRFPPTMPYPANPRRPVLALLPGSRANELTHHWPTFLATYRQLKTRIPTLTGLVAVENAEALKRLQSMGWDEGLTSTIGDARFNALPTATAALTKSGTNNLELALLTVPAVVAYRMNRLTYLILKYILRLNIPFISPPNIILQRVVYPEHIQNDATPTLLANAVQPLLADPNARSAQIKALVQVRSALQTTTPPLQLAAQTILKYLK